MFNLGRSFANLSALIAALGCSPSVKIAPSTGKGAPAAQGDARTATRTIFCTTTVDEWDMPRCLHELTSEQQRRRGWSLALTFEGDRVVRKDAVNGRGLLIDDETRVASRVYRYQNGAVVEVEGRSRTGVLRRRTRFIRDEDTNAVVWLDHDERPLPLVGTRALGATRELDDRGRVIEAAFFDGNGRLTPNKEGVYVIQHEYDAASRHTKEAYFDANFNPMPNEDGV